MATARVRDLLGLALAAAVAVALGWQIVRTGLSLEFSERAPDNALHWRSDNPDALIAIADARLAGGEPAHSAKYARQALKTAPGAAAAYRILAQTAFLEGDSARGEQLMDAGGRLSRRDPAIAYWLYRDALFDRRYTTAAMQADALMRRAPRTVAIIVPDLRASLYDEGARQALVQRLALRPPWREAFLAELAAGAPADVALQMLGALADSAAPPSNDELSPLFVRMVRDGDMVAARRTWAGFLPPAERPAGDAIFDEGFRYAPAPSPFGWGLRSRRGSRAQLEPQSGPGLRVSLDGFSQSLVAFQLLLLEPGTYQLTSAGHLMEGSTGGLEWRVTCRGNKAPLTRLTLTSEGGGALSGETSFSVPPGCPAQQLSLFGLSSEPPTPSTISVDRVHVERAG